jgi:preprotein translocase subunit YajC
MDWVFYLVVGAVLFVFIVGVLVVRYFLTIRLEEAERKAEQEDDAQNTAEANSGL